MKINDPLFSEAISAIDNGDVIKLDRLISKNPELLSNRLNEPVEGYFKHPYLLWFVAGNPTRQETLPENIIEITRLIIEALKEKNVTGATDQLTYTLALVCSGKVSRECGVQESLIDLLVEHGADPDHATTAALIHEEVAAVERLIHHGAAMTLSVAISTGRKNEVARLISQHTLTEMQEALAVAALYGQADIIKLLLAQHADLNAFNPEGFHSHSTALHQASISGSLEAVKVLVEAGADLRIRDKLFSGTPLAWAKHGHHTVIAEYLLDRMARQVTGRLLHEGLISRENLEKITAIIRQEFDQ